MNKTILLVAGIPLACLIGLSVFLMAGDTDNDRPLLAEAKEEVQTQEHVKYYDVGFKKDVESEQLAGTWVLVEDAGRDFYRISFQATHIDSVKVAGSSPAAATTSVC